MLPDSLLTAHQRLLSAIAKAKASSARRIPGDGDGDGIPHEGRNKKPAGKPVKLDAAQLLGIRGKHSAMSSQDDQFVRLIEVAAKRGNLKGVQGYAVVMGSKAGKAYVEAVACLMGGAAEAPNEKPKATSAPTRAPSEASDAPKEKPPAASTARPEPKEAPQPKEAPKEPQSGARKPSKAQAAAQAAAAGEAAHKAAAVLINAPEKEALQAYSGALFRTLNPRLRAGKPPERRDSPYLKQMDSAFSRASTKEPVTVFRGIDAEIAAKLTKGASFEDRAFVSTSTSLSMADGFSFGGAVMEIRVPKGSKAISVRDLSQFGHTEQEIVLNRGARFRVVDRTEASGFGARFRPARIVVEYLQ